MPEAEQLASALVTVPTEWSRLVGWAVLACHFPEKVDRSDLEDALAHFMERSRAKDFFVLRDMKWPLGPLPDLGIFENFMISALKSLLANTDAKYQSRLIAEVGKSKPNVSIGFVSRFEALLKDLGLENTANPWLRSTRRFMEAVDLSAHKKARKAEATLMTEVVPSAFSDNNSDPAPQLEFKYLAAFCDLAGIMRVPWIDAYVWLSDDTRLDMVHVLLRAAAFVFELPPERLAAETRQVITTIESLRQDGKEQDFLGLLPKVDVAEINWNRAATAEFDLDTNLVECLIHHRSQWVQRLSAHFIDARLHGAARRCACERLLAAGTGDALYWASALTFELSDGCELLVHRLGGRDTAGLHHLFKILTKRGCQITPSHLQVLEKGLFNRGAKTAKAAARWCQNTASRGDTWLVHLLRSASSYWVEHEEPYPENGGIVPDSPREALLRTLCRIEPPAFEELVGLTVDPRSDVGDAAIDGIIGIANDSSEEKLRVVESIVAKRFSLRQCEKLIGSSVRYDSEELLKLCELCSDQDTSFRMVVVRHVLTHHDIDPEKALAVANSMRSDDDGNVRDAVHQFLDRRG